MDALLYLVGIACCVHTAREILGLLGPARAGSAPPRPPSGAGLKARDARTGRSLTFRLDRRQGGRRVVDARSSGTAGEARWSAVS